MTRVLSEQAVEPNLLFSPKITSNIPHSTIPGAPEELGWAPTVQSSPTALILLPQGHSSAPVCSWCFTHLEVTELAVLCFHKLPFALQGTQAGTEHRQRHQKFFLSCFQPAGRGRPSSASPGSFTSSSSSSSSLSDSLSLSASCCCRALSKAWMGKL